MYDELLYRGLTLVFLSLTLGISATFRRRADQAGGALRGKRGLRLVLVLRLLSIVVLLPLFGYLINPAWVAWARVDLPTWARWLGIAGATAAIPLCIWILASIGTNISPSHATREGHQLITHGPYHWVRHPLYSAGLLLFISLRQGSDMRRCTRQFARRPSPPGPLSRARERGKPRQRWG